MSGCLYQLKGLIAKRIHHLPWTLTRTFSSSRALWQYENARNQSFLNVLA